MIDGYFLAVDSRCCTGCLIEITAGPGSKNYAKKCPNDVTKGRRDQRNELALECTKFCSPRAGCGHLNRRGKWPRLYGPAGRGRTEILQDPECSARETAVIESRSINIEYQPRIAQMDGLSLLTHQNPFSCLNSTASAFHDSSQSSLKFCFVCKIYSFAPAQFILRLRLEPLYSINYLSRSLLDSN